VLLPNCTEEDAKAVIGRMRQTMPPGQRCSVGLARWDGDEPLATLITRADEALYEDKAQARSATVAKSY
jgi:GGDEF domain-containing protein